LSSPSVATKKGAPGIPLHRSSGSPTAVNL
jgi:hypothetical protein